MKKILCAFFAVFLTLAVYAADGPLWGSKNKDLKVLKTQWFDIIFPPESQESALHLYKNADRIYLEIADLYGRPPLFRMPVVLTPAVETYNAFFAIAPYNHIVLYDTIPPEELLVNSDSLLTTFRHELTHAYTYNLKSETLKKVDSFFGDPLVLSVLSITPGWAEGATLTSESAAGEGRLNDEYSLHMVRQAKIENQFPKYADVQGASDIYPMGSFYNFNGSFNEWLQKTYGMEKYANFWYSCVNGKKFFVGRAFKSIYGIKINDAWEKFRSELYIPNVETNPLEAGLCFDFFEPDAKNYSPQNEAGSIYQNLCQSEKGLYYIDGASVFFTDGKSEVKKIFTHRGLNQISPSRDGRFLAIQFTAQNSATYKERIAIYDCLGNYFYNIEESSKTNPAIITCESKASDKKDYYLLYTDFKGQKEIFTIKKLLFDDKTKNISGLEKIRREELERNVFIFSFTDLGSGDFAFIKSDSLNFSILRTNLAGAFTEEYKLPSSTMRLRNLSLCENNLYFSWTDKGTLPRLGQFDLIKKDFKLQKSDLSGGVFSPLSFDKKIFYIGNFYRQNRLFIASKKMETLLEEAAGLELQGAFFAEEESSLGQERPFLDEDAYSSDESVSALAEDASPLDEGTILTNAQPFKMTSYIRRGIFLPLSLTSSKSYTEDFTSYNHYLPFGVTYISSTPWTSGSYYILSAGYGLETNSFASSITLNGGSDTSLISYSSSLSSEFDFKGWKQSDIEASLDLYFPFATISKISIYNSAYGFVGKNNKNSNILYSLMEDSDTDIYSLLQPGAFAPESQDINFYAYNNSGISYSNIFSSGPGKYERLGFSLSQIFTYAVYKNFNSASLKHNGNITSNFKLYLPKLLPIICKNGYTYNLPLKISAALLPFEALNQMSTTDDNEITTPLLSFAAQTLLFASEIQKALPFVSALFANEFYIVLKYNGSFLLDGLCTWAFTSLDSHLKNLFQGNLSYSSLIELQAFIALSPNLGELTRSDLRTDFFASAFYSFEKNKFGFNAGISSSF
ncbi:MAG: hypothetical protein K5829_00755 [Treponema sp.]|nr:hypothetical protein [Treponema sp.]